MSEETVWSKLINLQSQDILNNLSLIYGSIGLDMEVRQELAVWFESTLTRMMQSQLTGTAYEEMTQRFKEELLNQMKLKMNELSPDPQKATILSRFLESGRRYQLMNSSELFSRLVDIFKRECSLLRDFQSGNYSNFASASREIDANVENMRQQLSSIDAYDMIDWNRNFNNYQMEMIVNSVQMTNGNDSPHHAIEVDLHMSSANLCSQNLKRLTPTIIEKLRNIGLNCDQLIKSIIQNYIKQWNFSRQQYGKNDFSVNGADLEKLQSWCSSIAQILLKILETIDYITQNWNVIPNDDTSVMILLATLRGTTSNSLRDLIRGSIIIENQPPQVIKTNTKFTASVRLLIGNALNSKLTLSETNITAWVVSDQQAKKILRMTDTQLDQAVISDGIMNNSTKFEYSENSKHVIGNFRNLLLKSYKRNNRRTADLVTDEKCGIIFKIQMSFDGMKIQEKILSNSIVIIVHGSQETNAMATIFWDTAFAAYDREPFNVTDNVKWKDFAAALSYRVYAATGRELTAENLHFLAEKFYGCSITDSSDDLIVSYSDFTKERLKDREFTFWEWFNAAFKLICDHLRSSWNENCIIGFIDKKKTEELLQNCVHGTFILRFSDSELGALSIAWINRNIDGTSEIIHIQPTKAKEFETTCLAKRIHQFEDLEYLYPQYPKHDAFRVDETPYSPGNYIRCVTVMRVERRPESFGWDPNAMNMN